MRWRCGAPSTPGTETGGETRGTGLVLERQFETGSEERMTLWFAEADGALLRLEHREKGRLLTMVDGPGRRPAP